MQDSPALPFSFISTRGDFPLIASRTSLTWPAAVAIVALRFVIGAHFFHEGFTKWRDPKPFSAPMFGAAKGPFSEFYRNLVWDRDGLLRLDRDDTLAVWGVTSANKGEGEFGGGYLAEAIHHFKFDQEQANQAADLVMARVRQYDAALDQWGTEIEEYHYGLERRRENAGQSGRKLASFEKHDSRIATELNSKRMPWQTEIDRIWKGLERDINDLADQHGLAGRGYLAIAKPGRHTLDSETFDRFIPYFDMTIGVLLVVGLLTRVTASLAAAFLVTVIASQWPFARDAMATNYQQVEMCALLVLATVGAGRYAGLDAVLESCCSWKCCHRGGNASAAPVTQLNKS